MSDILKGHLIEVFLHIIGWILVFSFPLMFARGIVQSGGEMVYFVVFFNYLLFFLLFYINYLVLIPKYLFRTCLLRFLLVNALLVGIFSYAIYEVHNRYGVRGRSFYFSNTLRRPENAVRGGDISSVPEKRLAGPKCTEAEGMAHSGQKSRTRQKIRTFHNFVLMLLVIAFSVLVRYTQKWFLSKGERNEIEKMKAELELKNLKNQLNPHFLFNTLNNIYALIGISQEKAQNAVIDLSKLLRYVLYEGDGDYVMLSKEVEFLSNYVKLMQLRLASNVTVDCRFNVDGRNDMQVAQLLFIPLVENAFKHGVSTSHNDSFVRMKLFVNEARDVEFEISNSFYPKPKEDKSGSGIGLDNLRKRLEILYPHQHSYSVRVENGAYYSRLILKAEKDKI